jgi:hypothetical protein
MTALHCRFCILKVGLILVAFFLIKHWDTALFIRSTVDLQIERSPVSERVELYPDRPVEMSPVSEKAELYPGLPVELSPVSERVELCPDLQVELGPLSERVKLVLLQLVGRLCPAVTVTVVFFTLRVASSSLLSAAPRGLLKIWQVKDHLLDIFNIFSRFT